MPTAETINAALALHRAGKLAEAEQAYRQILAEAPHLADGWNMLGLVEHQTQRHERAIESLRRAISLKAERADFHNHLGEALRATGRIDEAIASYQRAIELQPRMVQAYFNLANVLAHRQQLPQAVEVLRRCVEIKPDYAAAWNNLAGLLKQQGRWDDALAAFAAALRAQPDYVFAHNNYGAALSELGRLEEAEASYRRVLELRPDFSQAHYNLANLFHRQERWAEALASYREAARFNPRDAQAHNNLGAMYQRLHEHPAAEASYREAIRVNPEYAAAYYNLGHVLQEVGRHEEAEEAFRAAIRLQGDYSHAWCNLGVTLTKLGRLDESVAALREAVRCGPDSADAFGNLGVALKELNQLNEAREALETALRLRPDYSAAHNNLGNVLRDLGDREGALACYQRAVQYGPDVAEAKSNLAAMLCGFGQLDLGIELYRDAIRKLPHLAETRGNLANALMDQGNLAAAVVEYREALRLKPTFYEAHSNLLFCLTHDSQATPDEIFAEHLHWARLHAARGPFEPHTNDRRADRPLRLGYVSADFRAHAINRFFEPILKHHDREKFEVFCYSQVSAPDDTTRRLQGMTHAWRNIFGVSDERVAATIREDAIDILIDLSGHTAGNRLPMFGRKPAPVQCTFMGYPNTTGVAAVDYRLTDGQLSPPGDERYSTEQLVRFARGAHCFSPKLGTPAPGPLPALKNGFITFGSLHRLSKVNAGVYDLWASVLKRLPTSRLLMFRDTLSGKLRETVQREFIERGIPTERLDLRHEAGPGGYLTVFHEIDISLDTFPYNGGTISCESVWMGVPFVTLRGDRPAARAGASLLSAVGVPELIATTQEEYVELTAALAVDRDRLAVLRATLRERMLATISDCEGYTREFERILRELWTRWATTTD